MNAGKPKSPSRLGSRPKEVVDSPSQTEVEAALNALIDAVVPMKPPKASRPKPARTGRRPVKTAPKH
jgi:hypothetical protein